MKIFLESWLGMVRRQRILFYFGAALGFLSLFLSFYGTAESYEAQSILRIGRYLRFEREEPTVMGPLYSFFEEDEDLILRIRSEFASQLAAPFTIQRPLHSERNGLLVIRSRAKDPKTAEEVVQTVTSSILVDHEQRYNDLQAHYSKLIQELELKIKEGRKSCSACHQSDTKGEEYESFALYAKYLNLLGQFIKVNRCFECKESIQELKVDLLGVLNTIPIRYFSSYDQDWITLKASVKQYSFAKSFATSVRVKKLSLSPWDKFIYFFYGSVISFFIGIFGVGFVEYFKKGETRV